MCDGPLVEADPSDGGAGTDNPECDELCDGEMVAATDDRFGWISNDGASISISSGFDATRVVQAAPAI